MGTYEAGRMIEEIDVAMSTIRDAMHGIPFGRNGFKRQHDQLARDVAALTVAIDDVRHLLRAR
jgi:hypothetical protein